MALVSTNTWNRIRYTIYQPIYDLLLEGYFYKFRKRSIESLDIEPGASVLIIGAGTGLDLEFLSPDHHIHAIDITPAMVRKLQVRAQKLGLNVSAQTGDGQNLIFNDEEFDIVIMHLILAVFPDAKACIKEAERVLKPGGSFTIMDKFIQKEKESGLFRRLINPLSNIIATNLNRDVDEILSYTGLKKSIHLKLSSIFWLIQGTK